MDSARESEPGRFWGVTRDLQRVCIGGPGMRASVAGPDSDFLFGWRGAYSVPHTVATADSDTEAHVILPHSALTHCSYSVPPHRSARVAPLRRTHTVATAYRGLERCPDKVGGPRGGPDLGDREGYIRWS